MNIGGSFPICTTGSLRILRDFHIECIYMNRDHSTCQIHRVSSSIFDGAHYWFMATDDGQ